MRQLVGVSHVLATVDLAGLRSEDWDLIVVRGASLAYSIPETLHVLSFGALQVGPGKTSYGTLLFSGRQRGRTFRLTKQPPAVRDLIEREGVPWLNEQEALPYLQFKVLSLGPGSYPPRDLHEGELTSSDPFIVDADGNFVMGAFPRSDATWTWAIPFVPAHPELWLLAALAWFREKQPERFPEVNPWRSRDQWRTQDERVAASELARLRSERAAAIAEFDARELELEAAKANAARAAELGPRRLLTAQSDELVDATVESLEALGFTVINVDHARLAAQQALVEDLHISVPERPDFHILGEVKGYTRGAKASDLIQIGQHALRYLQREGLPPDRCWYIVNQFLEKDPDDRQAPLPGAQEDISVFAEGGGLIIDTRELFLLSQRVADGALSPETAREMLLNATGVFDSKRSLNA